MVGLVVKLMFSLVSLLVPSSHCCDDRVHLYSENSQQLRLFSYETETYMCTKEDESPHFPAMLRTLLRIADYHAQVSAQDE